MLEWLGDDHRRPAALFLSGQMADIVTTVLGLGRGLHEANPFVHNSVAAGLALKIGFIVLALYVGYRWISPVRRRKTLVFFAGLGAVTALFNILNIALG